MSRYVLRLTHIRKFHGWRPVDPDGPALYLYKSVSRERDHGFPIYKVTDNVTNARAWATRAGAEGYLTNKFDGLGYAVEEVAA
jgi:hypothetical protein